MTSLQETSGLGKGDPLWHHLGKVDRIVERRGCWLDVFQTLSREELLIGFLDYLGHPAQKLEVSEDRIKLFAGWLERRGEPVLGEVVRELRNGGMPPYDIRITIFYILAGLDLLLERDSAGKCRKRSAGAVWSS